MQDPRGQTFEVIKGALGFKHLMDPSLEVPLGYGIWRLTCILRNVGLDSAASVWNLSLMACSVSQTLVTF